MIKINKNKFFVKELKTGYVVLGDNQHFKGYTLFLYKEHENELYQLEPNEKLNFLRNVISGGSCIKSL